MEKDGAASFGRGSVLHRCGQEGAYRCRHRTARGSKRITRLADDAFAHGVQDQVGDAVQVQLLQDVGAVSFHRVQA